MELKGNKVNDAYEQLVATLGHEYLQKRHDKITKRCYIVASKVPKAGTDIQVYKKRLKKLYQASLTIREIKIEITV